MLAAELSAFIAQEWVVAGSSATGWPPALDSYAVDCSSMGGLVLRMKKAKTSAAMLIRAATLKAVAMPPFRAEICGRPAWLRVAVLVAMIATSNAVPAAPATCCRVPKIALPWE